MHSENDNVKIEDQQVNLKVNGKNVDMVPFVHDTFRDMVLAFINNLRGVEKGKIEIIIE
jgi:hypothetical protein